MKSRVALPPLKALVVNGKKKVAVNGVVNLNLSNMKGGVQADWNQNDENAPDYIKNRICYSETVGREYYNQSEGYEAVTLMGSMPAEKYTAITYDEFKERTFTCTQDSETYTASTNGAIEIAPGVIALGEAIILATVEFQGIAPGLYFIIGDGVEEYNLSAQETVHKIDEMFIPDQNNVIFRWEHETQKNIQLKGNYDLSNNDSFNVYSATELTINDFTSYGTTDEYNNPEGLSFTYDENTNTYTSVSRMPWSGFESNDCVVCVATKNQETNKYTLYKVDSWIYDSSTNLVTMELDEGPETDANFFIISGIAAGGDSIAIGNGAVSTSNSVAIGCYSVANSKDGGSVAIGNNSFSAFYSVAIGNATASGDYAISVGEDSKASGDGAISVGYYSNAKGNHSIALLGGTTNNEGEIAIGNSWGSSAATSQTLIKFDRTTTPPTMKVSFDNGSTWGTVQITF